MIAIATPAYGGQVTLPYMLSCLELRESLIHGGVEHTWITCYNESLIQRARNKLVRTFMVSDMDRLMFIDADIQFNAEDVAKLWNMDADIAVGAYPMKRKDAPASAWVDGKIVNLDSLDGETEVDYAGTGFMMIKRDVFTVMENSYPESKHEEAEGEMYAHFDCGIFDGAYLSEDYLFCKKARDIGIDIILDPSIKLVHWGNYGYGM